MSASVARLETVRVASETRIARAYASSPQRWTAACRGSGGWGEVTHQLLGDGSFSGDRHRTHIRVGAGSRLLVRGVASTPLRGPGRSLAAVSLKVERAAALIYMPGPLVPHAASSHTNAVSLSLEEGASALAASIVVPGRSAMGEVGAFRELRLKTVVRVAGRLCLAEDAALYGGSLNGAGLFAGGGAYVSFVAAGCSPAADPDWWQPFAAGALGVSKLRHGGLTARGLFPTLGGALALAAEVEAAWRAEVGLGAVPASLASAQSRAG